MAFPRLAADSIVPSTRAFMARRAVPEETQFEVLAACRRRCAICFGLNRDTGIKRGQIAHLDGDAANPGLASGAPGNTKSAYLGRLTSQNSAVPLERKSSTISIAATQSMSST